MNRRGPTVYRSVDEGITWIIAANPPNLWYTNDSGETWHLREDYDYEIAEWIEEGDSVGRWSLSPEQTKKEAVCAEAEWLNCPECGQPFENCWCGEAVWEV